MTIKEKIETIFKVAKEHLSAENLKLARHFYISGETELAIEFLCDLFVELGDIFSEDFGELIKDVASELKMLPKRTWRDIIVRDKKTLDPYRLYTGKNPILIIQELRNILIELGPKLTKEVFDAAKEYVDVDEYALAVEVLCAGLIDEKIRISRDLFSKINTAIIDTHNDLPDESDFIRRQVAKNVLLEE